MHLPCKSSSTGMAYIWPPVPFWLLRTCESAAEVSMRKDSKSLLKDLYASSAPAQVAT